jgi:hypothetical protein
MPSRALARKCAAIILANGGGVIPSNQQARFGDGAEPEQAPSKAVKGAHEFNHMEPPMTDWREHLTPDESDRLEAIKVERLTLSREQRRIFDRARKRGNRKPG